MNQIISFDKEYAFLSNFYPCTVNAYKSAEAAYQAQKCENPRRPGAVHRAGCWPC